MPNKIPPSIPLTVTVDDVKVFRLVQFWTSSYVHFHLLKTHGDHVSRRTTNQQNDMCAQRRLRLAWASTQSDQSLLSTWRKLGSLAAHWAHCKDSDQTGRMPRLTRVFAGRTCHLGGFVMLSHVWFTCSSCDWHPVTVLSHYYMSHVMRKPSWFATR